MPFSPNILDRERDKFLELLGETAVRVSSPLSEDLLNDILQEIIKKNTRTLVHNVNLVLSGFEYSFSLPTNCIGFLFRSQKGGEIKLKFDSMSNFITIKKGCVYESLVFYEAQTIYFETDISGDIIELVTHNIN